jgi:hypothetical protein
MVERYSRAPVGTVVPRPKYLDSSVFVSITIMQFPSLHPVPYLKNKYVLTVNTAVQITYCILFRGIEGGRYHFVSRYFAPWVGIPEDPVTGSAHTVLAPYWQTILGR